MDVAAVDRHTERLRLEAGAAALGARHLTHVALDLLPHVVRLRLRVAALQVRDNALVVRVVGAHPPVPVLVLDVDLLGARAVQQHLLVGLLQLAERCRRPEPVGLGHRLQDPVEVLAPGTGPGRHRAVVDRQVRVGDHQLRVHLVPGAEAGTVRAGPVRGVEGEAAGRQLLERGAVVGAGQVLGEGQDLLVALPRLARLSRPARIALPPDQLHLGHALRKPQGGLHGVGQAALDPLPADQSVDDHLDGVLLVAGQLGRGRQLADLAVDPRPHEALAGQLLQQSLVLALAAPHDRRQDL